MSVIDHFEAADFPIERVRELKGRREIFVVFSTCGEREADLIHDKVRLLHKEAGGLIDTIFLSHRRRGDVMDLTERKALQADPNLRVLLNNTSCPPDMDDETGKGSDMRRALYQMNLEYVNGRGPDEIVVVFLDSDVLPEYFGTHFVTALAGPVLQGYDFSKASFWRAMGRVKKFVAQPLFSIIDHPGIQKLTNFAYPLSGEVAGTLAFFNSVNFWQIYGVETGINIDTCFGPYSIADVNLGLYDHRHQSDLNIQKMSFGIIRTFLLQLIDNGIIRLEDGAKVSDIFRAHFIDDEGSRNRMEFNLSERKYQPLNKVLPADDFNGAFPHEDKREAAPFS